MRLDSAVTAVDHDDDSVAVRTAAGDVVEADHVVIAVPAPVLPGIEFRPALREEIRTANAAIRYGQDTKVAVVVPSRSPLQAKAFVAGQLIRAGWRTRRVLYGFAAPESHHLDAATLAQDLCHGFGVDPRTVQRIELVDWPQDCFTCGTYAHLPPRRFLEFWRSLPHRHSRVHLAGAERSSWPVFMGGAVESGETAADSIIAGHR